MKEWSCPFGRMGDEKNKPKHPERTAHKYGSSVGDDVQFKEWPTRERMAKAIRREQDRGFYGAGWQAVVKLEDNEGYG